MTRLAMNAAIVAGVYIGGVWIWQNILPVSARNMISSATHQAVNTLANAVH